MTYDYKCPNCKENYTLTRSITTAGAEEICASCGARLIRIYSVPVIHYKGNGFYAKDNRTTDTARESD